MKSWIRSLWLLPLLVVAIGCQITPKTSALKAVHDTYREEFATLNLPTPDAVSGGATNPPGEPFPRTLRAIREFRVSRSNETVLNAHLTVLEGMVYLQGGRIGMARLLIPKVGEAAGQLGSGTGSWVRDRLFAVNFPALVKGFGEIQKASDRLPNRQPNFNTRPSPAALNEAVRDIVSDLAARRSRNELASPEADDGAAYLAACAAVFSAWSYEIQREPGSPGDAELRKTTLSPARDALGAQLSDTERTAAGAADDLAPGESVPPGRLRYLQWYRWLETSTR
jgi:hypothetical protein